MKLVMQFGAHDSLEDQALTHTGLMVDAHVHFHECFSWPRFLDAAVHNLGRAQRTAQLGRGAVPCLIMTEPAGQHAFRALRNASTGVVTHSGWQVTSTDEPCSLVLHHHDAATLVVIAGRQIISREKLEVLALGTEDAFCDGQPISDLVESVLASGAVAVLPWGFGKWWFARGRVIQNLIESKQMVGQVFLGDNSGRPQLSNPPPHFHAAASRGIYVLPGSDPLPFPGQVANVGRYGFFLPGTFSELEPAREVRDALRALDHQPRILGKREGFWRFCCAQAAMQVTKRLQKSSS